MSGDEVVVASRAELSTRTYSSTDEQAGLSEKTIRGHCGDMTHPLIRRSVGTRGELLAVGHTDSELRAALKADRLQRLSCGVYTEPGDLFAEKKHRLNSVAMARRSPQLAISHISALLMHGIAVWGAPLKKVHFTRRSDSGAGQSTHRIVHSAKLLDDEVISKDGRLLTTVARSLIDFARNAPHSSAVIALDSALRQELVTAEELVQAYGRIHRHRGAPAARRALLAADGRSESVGESRTRLAFAILGLPAPDLQVTISDPAGEFVGRTGFGFAGLGLLVEFDGAGKYSASDKDPKRSLMEEKRREDGLRQLGYVVLRLVWAELVDLPRLLAKVQAAMKVAARRMELGGCDGSYQPKPRVPII